MVRWGRNLKWPLATQLFSRFRVPGSRPDDGLQRPKHVVFKLRFTHISCNKLVCNSCLVRNLNSYIYLLCLTFPPSYFNTLISTMGMIHLNNATLKYVSCHPKYKVMHTNYLLSCYKIYWTMNVTKCMEVRKKKMLEPFLTYRKHKTC